MKIRRDKIPHLIGAENCPIFSIGVQFAGHIHRKGIKNVWVCIKNVWVSKKNGYTVIYSEGLSLFWQDAIEGLFITFYIFLYKE